jgi:hypothetical protein
VQGEWSEQRGMQEGPNQGVKLLKVLTDAYALSFMLSATDNYCV